MWNKLFSTLIIFVIFTSTKSMIIDCQWNGDQCYKILSITQVTQPNEVVTFVGKPANYISFETKFVLLENSVVNYLPPAFFTAFPYLFGLSIVNCQTTTLAANPNFSCAHLDNFYIVDGIVLNIPEGFLQSCSRISLIHLRKSRIETIDKNAFKGLTQLTTLELPFNNITCIPADLFQNLPILRTISLLDNKIVNINSGTFRNLPALGSVSVANNLLKYLPTFDFNGTATQIQCLFTFGDNPIYALSPDFTSIYPKRGSLPGIGFNFARARCLVNEDYYIIHQTNYMDSGPYLQKCYQNWTSSMTGTTVCGQSSVTTTTAAPLCPIASFWQQLLDYLKSLKLI